MSAAAPNETGERAAMPPGSWDWTSLHERLRPRLLRIAVHRYGFRPDEAEDLVQDVFENVWARRPRVRCPEAYLRTSFHHRCADELATAAHQARRSAAPLDDGLHDRRGPEAILAACTVRAAFARLDEPCRGLVRSHVFEGRTLAETAASLGSTVTAVWKRVNRCLRKLIPWLT